MTKADSDRDARLAAALRDNLRRRKAQGREAAGRETPDQNNAATDPASE